MKTKLFTLFLLLVASVGTMFAEDVKIGDLYYYIEDYAGNKIALVSPSDGDKYAGDITIPSSIEYKTQTYSVIGTTESAFEWCTDLTSVTIPNSVIYIGGSAFYGCTGLTSVIIPNSVTFIDVRAFGWCTGLNSITIPNSVTSIEAGTFEFCSNLTSIEIPNSVTKIDSWAFDRCTSLTSVICYATTPPNLVGYPFTIDCSNITLYVPAESIEAYKAADQWKDFNPILPISGIEGIEDIHVDSDNPVKVLHEGQVYILNGEKSYTITGQEL